MGCSSSRLLFACCIQVVECYGIFDSLGEISFVLELMDGGTLGDVVKKKVKPRAMAHPDRRAWSLTLLTLSTAAGTRCQ